MKWIAEMYRHDTITAVLAQRVLGIIRTADAASAIKAGRQLLDAGLHAIEITLTNPQALQAIEQLYEQYPDAVIGAGTVLDEASAVLAIRAGARFLVSPNLNVDVVRTAHRYGIPALPGTGSVTEIVRALEAGADAIKLFPASSFGPGWISDVRAALPQAPIVPTGGISLEAAPDWIRAGAVACGIGSSLTKGDPATITDRIAALLAGLGDD
jgi:2-dehydro-3-deoxyphosphogluconate aldolase/(4S)-4-hydroxy-2-oxoglutarate aldolase